MRPNDKRDLNPLPACPICQKKEGGVFYECVKCGRRGHVTTGLLFGGSRCIDMTEMCPLGDSHDFKKLNTIQKQALA